MKQLLTTILFTLMTLATANSQENLSYQFPPQSILQLADYQRPPSVTMDTRKTYMLLSYRPTYKSLDDLNQQEISLAGLRVNPSTNISSSMSYISSLKMRKLTDKEPIEFVGLPQNMRIANVLWSPDETKVAFTNTVSNGIELWIADFVTAKATKLTEAILNANVGNPVNWFRDSKSLLVRMLPAERSELIDVKKALPAGPIISVSDGSKSQNRTYQDMLKNPTDEANFVTLTTAELYKVQLDGSKKLFKEADLYVNEIISPDGNYVIVTTLRKPFSYIVPLNRFPQTNVVYDANGTKVKTISEIPLSEVLPKGFMAVRTGKRSLSWRADEPSTLFWVEALDEGNPQKEVPFRDAVYLWKAPFTDGQTQLCKTALRFSRIVWGNATTAVLSEEWYDTRQMKVSVINPSNPEQSPRLFSARNFQDVYADPGDFETQKNAFGKYVLTIENENAYLLGDGFTAKGQFPFIDELNLSTLKTKRLYQSALTNEMEEIQDIVDVKKGEVLIRKQSKNEFPNYFIRNIKKRIAPLQITYFKNPFESIAGVHKELIKYKRADGVELSGTLYLPIGYDIKAKTEKLPLLIWAYPAEYKDKNSAGQSTANPNEFTYPYYGSFVYWVTRGYAVLDDAAFPIVGEGKTEPNDTFVGQLVANAKAAIDAVDSLGFIDRKKVAVGGHSYGAFMTANLLTHCDLFACGIARSGAYNRTLTPFGFQSEQRNYWDVPEVYNTMSPFMQADKMKTPMLLVHGEADNNPGTFTLQTERYFQALKGLGAPARMVILPKEQHGYVARENILHLLWEQDRFLEKYLK
jgi:dipeptidyl aminopeptidase/acylaminoacyl peptidase